MKNTCNHYSVHVDCDNAWISEDELGMTHSPINKNYLYEVALINLLNLFDQHQIKATFFIVGKDLKELKACEEFCKKIISEGHKIGNHSFNHLINFGELSSAEREAEIIDAHNIILEKLGYECKSFRAPGYGVNNNDLALLAQKGYCYDSSTLPGFATLIMKLYVIFIRNYKKKSFRVWRNFFASTSPKKHHLTNQASIWSLPITVLPFFRLPIHTSFLFSFNFQYTIFVLKLLKFNRGLKVILFHGLDLAEEMNQPYKSIIPAFNVPFSKRFEISNILLKSTHKNTVHLEDILK
jgi:predicted deacetylase